MRSTGARSNSMGAMGVTETESAHPLAEDGGFLMQAASGDYLLSHQELQQLTEAAEQSGSIRQSACVEILAQREFGPLERDGVYRQLEQHGIEVVEDELEAPPQPVV